MPFWISSLIVPTTSQPQRSKNGRLTGSSARVIRLTFQNFRVAASAITASRSARPMPCRR